MEEGVADVVEDAAGGGVLVGVCVVHALNRGARTITARKRSPEINAYLNFMNSIPPL